MNTDLAIAWIDGHPWQFGNREHWVRVKESGLIARISDSDSCTDSDGVLRFALHHDDDSEDRWYRISELEEVPAP